MPIISRQTSSPEAIAFAKELMKIKREAQAEIREARKNPEFRKKVEDALDKKK